MRKPRNEAGLKRLHRGFNVPTKPYEAGPNMRDSDPARGPLKYVPKESVARVMDFGGPAEGGSPASGTFTVGRPIAAPSQKETRLLPANQAVGSVKITP